MSDRYKIYIVEDNPGDAGLVQEYLAECEIKNVETRIFTKLAQVLESLEVDKPDIVLLDLNLPDSNGLATFESIKEKAASAAIIILTGIEQGELGITAVSEGAQDFLNKHDLTPVLLKKTIRHSYERRKTEIALLRRTQVLSSIRKINKLITQVSSRKELIDQACDILAEIEEYLHSWIIIFGADGKIELSAENGVGEKFDEFVNYVNNGNLPACIRDTAAADGIGVMKKDQDSCGDCPLRFNADTETTCANMKLIRGNNLMGILHVHISNSYFEDETEGGLVEEIAGDISLALEYIVTNRKIAINRNLFEALTELSLMDNPSTDDAIRFAIEKVVELTESEGAHLHFYDEVKVSLDYFKWSNSVEKIGRTEKFPHSPLENSGIWENCVRNRSCVIHNDFASEIQNRGLPEGQIEIKRHMCVPIFDGDKIVAVCSVGNKSAPYSSDDAAVVDRLVSAMWKIVQRNESEQKVQESESRLSKIIENSNDAIYLLFKGKFEIINSKFEEIFGYSLEEVNAPSFNFMDIIAESSREKIKDRSERVSKGETVSPIYEFTALAKDGEEVECETSVTYIDYKGGTAVLGIVRDITDRKNMELTLQKYSMAVRQSPAFMVITDVEGQIEFANPSFLEATGYTMSELSGKNPRIFKSGFQSPEVYKTLWETILSGKVWKGEFLNKKKDGELFWESLEIVPILNDEGEIISFLKVSHDTTLLKNAENELNRARDKAESGDRLKSEFLNQISHEVRTPLHGMQGMIEILDDTLSEDLDDDLREIINSLKLEAGRIVRTMDSVINMASLESKTFEFDPKRTNFSELLLRVCKRFRTTAEVAGLKFEVKDFTDESMVIIDSYAMEQVVANLIDNAVKYTEEGGIEVTLSGNVGDVVLQVRDTGIGISEEYMPYLFDYFSQENVGTTRKYDGIGLGLSLVKRFCDMNRAKVSVESKKGAGSTFTVVMQKV